MTGTVSRRSSCLRSHAIVPPLFLCVFCAPDRSDPFCRSRAGQGRAGQGRAGQGCQLPTLKAGEHHGDRALHGNNNGLVPSEFAVISRKADDSLDCAFIFFKRSPLGFRGTSLEFQEIIRISLESLQTRWKTRHCFYRLREGGGGVGVGER